MVAGNRYYTAYTRCSCEIKKRRRELGNLIKRFRSGAESLPDAVVLTTEEGGIFWCNGLAQQILGLRWPEDNGQNILNLLRYPEFTQYLKTRDFFLARSIWCSTPGGIWKFASCLIPTNSC